MMNEHPFQVMVTQLCNGLNALQPEIDDGSRCYNCWNEIEGGDCEPLYKHLPAHVDDQPLRKLCSECVERYKEKERRWGNS